MSSDTVQEALNESNFIRNRVIKDLETGNEYPYSDVAAAVAILKRVARSDGCPIGLALETLWVMGCSQAELRDILAACKS